MGYSKEIKKFNNFLGTLNHEYKIIIAGNHDFMFERDPPRAQSMLTNCIYLQDASIEINGIKIYGIII